LLGEFCSFLKKLPHELQTLHSQHFSEIRKIIEILKSQHSKVSSRRALYVMQTLVILTAQRVIAGKPNMIVTYRFTTTGTTGFEEKLTILWNNSRIEDNQPFGTRLGMISRAPEVDWLGVNIFSSKIATYYTLGLKNSSPTLLTTALNGPLATYLRNHDFAKLDIQSFVRFTIKKTTEPEKSSNLDIAFTNLSDRHEIDSAINLIPTTAIYECKLSQTRHLILLLATNGEPQKLKDLMVQNAKVSMDPKDRSDLFADAIGSLLLKKHTQTAIDVAKMAPQTQYMSKLLHDFSIGLFLGGKKQEALAMTGCMSDETLKNTTLQQLSKNPSEIATLFYNHFNNDHTNTSLLLENDVDTSISLKDYSRILRQSAGQDTPEELLKMIVTMNTWYSDSFSAKPMTCILMSKCFDKLLSMMNNESLSYKTRETSLQLLTLATPPQNLDTHQIFQVIKQLWTEYPPDSKFLQNLLKTLVKNLSKTGSVKEILQEVLSLPEKFNTTSIKGMIDTSFIPKVIDTILTTSIKAGKGSEVAEIFNLVPQKYQFFFLEKARETLVVKTVKTLLLFEKKDEAKKLFITNIDNFDSFQLANVFYVFMVLRDTEVIQRVMAKISQDPETYAGLLTTFFTYCLTTDNLDLFPFPLKDKSNDTFGKMKTVLDRELRRLHPRFTRDFLYWEQPPASLQLYRPILL
jgi:hypothetical protein